MLLGAESGSQRRKRKTTSSSTQSLNESAQYLGEDVQHERGRRGKAKARAPSSFAGEDMAVLRELGVVSHNTRSRKKERSKSRDTVSRRARTVSPEPTEDVDVGVPLAFDSTDVTRMQREIEALRKVCVALSFSACFGLSDLYPPKAIAICQEVSPKAEQGEMLHLVTVVSNNGSPRSSTN